MILSNLMGAIIFGNVATLIQSLNAGENRHANRIEMVEELIETHGISDELAERMRHTCIAVEFATSAQSSTAATAWHRHFHQLAIARGASHARARPEA